MNDLPVPARLYVAGVTLVGALIVTYSLLVGAGVVGSDALTSEQWTAVVVLSLLVLLSNLIISPLRQSVAKDQRVDIGIDMPVGIASVLLLAQVLMMARLPVLEHAYGQDRLAHLHRLIGFTSFNLMVAILVFAIYYNWISFAQSNLGQGNIGLPFALVMTHGLMAAIIAFVFRRQISIHSLLRALRRQNVIIIYISHKLHEIPEIADTVAVLRDGEHTGATPGRVVDGPGRPPPQCGWSQGGGRIGFSSLRGSFHSEPPTSSPSWYTRLIRARSCNTVMSSSGVPSTTIRSASRPGRIDPKCSARRIARAAIEVADLSTSMFFMPRLTRNSRNKLSTRCMLFLGGWRSWRLRR